MDKQAHEKFLLKIAKSVSDLIVGNPANKDHFRQQIKAFCEMRDKFLQALTEYQEAAKANPKLQCKNEEEKPPKKGLELETHYVFEISVKTKSELKGCKDDFGRGRGVKRTMFWRPLLPFDPDRWLSYRYGYHWRGWIGQKPKEPPTSDESLACEYAVLAVVHDNAQEALPDCNRLIGKTFPSDRLWAGELWVEIEAFGYGGQTRSYGQRQNAIQLALDHVKAEASGKPVDPIPPPTEAKQENEVYIKKNNDNWEFGFNGGAAQVKFKLGKELKGLAPLEFLLTHPNKEYTPLKLLQETGQREKGETEPEKIYTDKDIGKIKEAIEGLKGRAELTTNLEEKARFEKEIKDTEAILHKTRSCKGKSRKFSEKHTKSVSRNVETVLKKIAPHNVELYNHLDTFLKRGEICYYKPDTEIFWKIS